MAVSLRRLPGRLLLPPTAVIQRRHPKSPAKFARNVGRMAGKGDGAVVINNEEAEAPRNKPRSNPEVAKIQDLIKSHPPGAGWDHCWQNGYTPWDQGKPTPIVMHLLETDALPKGRTLIPGCGTGYDVVAIAGPERYVIGVDISETSVKKSQELFSSLPNANCFTFLAEDLFIWQTDETFDLIFDYTFFCAIDPCLRSAWAKQIRDLLKPDGELITLMFPIGDYDGGPPYAVSLSAYENVLCPLGFEAISVEDNELAIEGRKGKEKLGRWKICKNQSLL